MGGSKLWLCIYRGLPLQQAKSRSSRRLHCGWSRQPRMWRWRRWTQSALSSSRPRRNSSSHALIRSVPTYLPRLPITLISYPAWVESLTLVTHVIYCLGPKVFDLWLDNQTYLTYANFSWLLQVVGWPRTQQVARHRSTCWCWKQTGTTEYVKRYLYLCWLSILVCFVFLRMHNTNYTHLPTYLDWSAQSHDCWHDKPYWDNQLDTWVHEIDAYLSRYNSMATI